MASTMMGMSSAGQSKTILEEPCNSLAIFNEYLYKFEVTPLALKALPHLQ